MSSDQTIESLKQEILSYVPEDVRDDVETTTALESTLKKMDEAQLETIGQMKADTEPNTPLGKWLRKNIPA